MNPARLRYLRRWYFLGLTAAFAILLLVRFFVIGAVDPTSPDGLQVAAQVTESLIASTAAAGFIGLLLAWLFPNSDDAPSMDVLQNWEIEPAIRSACQSTREWRSRARTASYFRSRTLPWLSEHSRTTRASVKVCVQVMDPADVHMHQLYVQFPGRIPGQGWDAARVRLEIYASIVSMLAWQKDNPRLEMEIRTSPSFEVLSLDISHTCVIVTGQYKGHPAVSHAERSAFYATYRDEFDASWRQSRALDTTVPCTRLDELTVESVKETLSALDVGADDLTETDLARIVQYAQTPEHRYR